MKYVDANYKGNRLNKYIKKENFKKDLMNLIEKNHQINMTSDHSVSSNNCLKQLQLCSCSCAKHNDCVSVSVARLT